MSAHPDIDRLHGEDKDWAGRCPVLTGTRIVIVLTCLELGGAERQALVLARHLVREYGARVEVWGFVQPGRAAALCDEYGIPWRIVPFSWAEGKSGRLIGMVRFARELRRARPDILLPYTMWPNVLCGLIWRWAGAKACVWN